MSKVASKADIVKHVKICDIALDLQIPLEEINGNGFDFRCTCPSAEHKNGNERTKSCYINSQTNSFHCFGCNAGSNCLDFYILCREITFGEALHELRDKIDPALISCDDFEIDQNNFSTLLQISELLRITLLNHQDDLDWINKLTKQIDDVIFDYKSTDTLAAEKLLRKVKNTLLKRYGE